MKQQLFLLAGSLLALCLPQSAFAQETQVPMTAEATYGAKVKMASIAEVKITNLQNQPLGRIQDVVLDLSNGRVVAALVSSDQTLRFGGTHVAVPPSALIPDAKNKVYQIDMSQEAFKAAPLFNLGKWADSTTPDKIAADYHYFGQTPYFLAPGAATDTAAPGAEYVHLGVLERMSKIINMDVDNLKGERLGKLETLVMDVPAGLILNTFIVANTTGTILRFSTIIPPTALTFNTKRDGLLLDDSKVQYGEEPHVVFETGSSGQQVSYRKQPVDDAVTPAAPAPVSGVAALVQGTDSHDINTTAQIYKSIKGSKLDAGEKVEVATLNGRVTLRGPVSNQAAKDGIAAIAVTAVELANVDDQMSVMQPQASL